ncbi:MAG TPA: ABC transporter ATP-binding protein [Candidatus Sumerlaeota bacterium]|nr:ABC transporter ATP-binding protein [Candidatus Sumerlaeota bacterium]HPK04197.1 ABC transporter ATP-binding protein [Candidatus Sumerlaeota bacterium]
MKPALIVENVYKKYSRNAHAHLDYGIRDLFNTLMGHRQRLALRADEFYAVENVSFQLDQGDSLGLIGRNGSGKTTLLRMCNGLIKPDGGRIMVDGRVQALIALGAGFNPKLSGRENIYNAAAVMGMNSRQTRAIFDEIVQFSELEEFIDSPIGTYSSGMYARLGFSVSVHLQPDVLLIDEILSVGDHAFQNKCFRKLHQIKKQGVTFVLVSHSQTHIVQMCERAIWLHQGRLMQLGPSTEVVQAYLDFLDQENLERLREQPDGAEAAPSRPKEEKRQPIPPAGARISEATRKAAADGLYHAVYDEQDRVEDVRLEFYAGDSPVDVVTMHQRLTIRYSFRLRQPVTDLNVSLVFYRADGLQLSTISTLNGHLLRDFHEGQIECEVEIEDFCLVPGTYVLMMPIHEGQSYLYRNVVKEFVVRSNGRLSWAVLDFPYRYRVLSKTPR